MSNLSAIDPVLLGSRLRIAREAANIRQEDAAKAINVSRTTIVAIEKGERRLTSRELTLLAREYGERVNRLLRSTAHFPDLKPQFRRGNVSANPPDDEQKVAGLIRSFASGYAEVEELLGIHVSKAYPPTHVIDKTYLAQQAQELALDARHRLGLSPHGPIQSLVELLETHFFFRILVRDLPSRVSGAFVFDDVTGPCILLNRRHPVSRQRWTLAHELGHFLTTRSHAEITLVEDSSGSIAEKFANLFANLFLMPSAGLRNLFAEISGNDEKFSLRHLVYMAHSFGVSIEAMARRLEDLDFLAKGTYEMVQPGLKGQMKVDDPQTEKPLGWSRFLLMVSECLEKGLLSEGQAAAMLGLDRLEMREALSLFEGGD